MSVCKIVCPLDPTFAPIAACYRDFLADARACGRTASLVIAVERNAGLCAHFRMEAFADGVDDARNAAMAERVVKSMLWMRGGFRVTLFGSRKVYEAVADAYRAGGAREFDVGFMSRVYERPFEVRYAETEAALPSENEQAEAMGRHLDGCRIGFDAGGSDRKVSAVVNGEAVYSEEVVWFPKTNPDPAYHYEGILTAMKSAAAHMPRVDAIGVSSAGVYVDNRIMVASLFLKVPQDAFDKEVKDMYIRVAKEIGDVPLCVCNDGDVTALAGAMSLETGNVLGIAMGTSEAGGYVDKDMNITGWLNELAFAPVDLQPDAMLDEWSLDRGCGVKYFSQDAVIKLAPAAGIALDPALSPADKLKAVQARMRAGDAGARMIYETIGVYFGYAIAWYSLFYDIDHVLIMGRVTSGEGGALVLSAAQLVLDSEFPELARKVALHLPDEKNRRVGQSVAAASLPKM